MKDGGSTKARRLATEEAARKTYSYSLGVGHPEKEGNQKSRKQSWEGVVRVGRVKPRTSGLRVYGLESIVVGQPRFPYWPLGKWVHQSSA